MAKRKKLTKKERKKKLRWLERRDKNRVLAQIRIGWRGSNRKLKQKQEMKVRLYYEQDGECARCGEDRNIRKLVKHRLLPKDHKDSKKMKNLQLLCWPCKNIANLEKEKILKGVVSEL